MVYWGTKGINLKINIFEPGGVLTVEEKLENIIKVYYFLVDSKNKDIDLSKSLEIGIPVSFE